MTSLVVDARMLWHSGIGRYLRALIPLFLQEGSFNFTFIANDDPRSRSFFGKDHPVFYTKAPIYSLQEQGMFMLRGKCDLFWSPHYNIPLTPIKARKRVVTIHDVYHLAHSYDLSWHKRFYAHYVLKKAVSISDAVITISQFSKEEIIRYTSACPSKITTIHLGVDSYSFGKKGMSGSFHGAIEDDFFLYVGNFKEHKNIDTLLKAYRRFVSLRGRKVKLILAGRSFPGCCLRKLIAEYGLQDCVFVLEEIGDEALVWLYQHAKVFIFPSLYEGFGLPPLEAMAAGCPVIASHAASIPEVCKDGAYYFDPKDERDLCSAMIKVLENQSYARDLIERGFATADLYSWREAATKHLNVFRDLIG